MLNPFLYLIYYPTLLYKWIEFQIFKCIVPVCEWGGQYYFRKSRITINGPSPGDIQVHNKAMWPLVASAPSLGLGESYMAGYWDCDQIDELFYKIFKSGLH